MKNYNENNIQTVPFGQAVRTKLGMYLVADKQQALRLGLRELIYNSQDEYEQGYGNLISIEINSKERKVTVQDNARGIPCGVRDDGVNALVAACTLPHSGAKHNNEVYATAAGINGIGLKIVCHTSETFDITSYRQEANGLGEHFFFNETDNGANLVTHDQKQHKDKKIVGTHITYVPSKIVYGNNWFDKDEIFNDLQELSYFAKGLKITIDFDGEKRVFYSKNGLLDALKKKEPIHKNILYCNEESDDVRVEMALHWTKDNPMIMPYANNLNVPEGGAFITGFKTSLTKAFNNALETNFTGEIIRKYLDGYISVKVGTPQFSNQSKTALANPEARTAVSKITTELIKNFFVNHPKDAEAIKNLLEREQKAEKAAQRAREAEKSLLTGGKKSKMITNLPSKLVDAIGKGGESRELFIAEGEHYCPYPSI